VSPRLETRFGHHTFFLDAQGLNIVEPSAADDRMGNVVNLASWTDDKRTVLAPHPPEATPVVVDLGASGEDEEEDEEGD